MKNPRMASLPQAIVFSKNVLFFTFIIMTMLLSCSKDSADQLATNDLNTIQATMKSNNGQDGATVTIPHNGRTLQLNTKDLLESAKNGTTLMVGEGECDCEYEVLDLEFIGPDNDHPYNSARLFTDMQYCNGPTSCLFFLGYYESDCGFPSPPNSCVDYFNTFPVDYPFNCQPISTYSTFPVAFWSRATDTDCEGPTTHRYAKVKFQINCVGIYYGPDTCEPVPGLPLGQSIYSSDVFTIELNNESHKTMYIQLDGCGCDPIEAHIIEPN